MKTVLIVDDEKDARDLLRFYIAQHDELSIVGEASNGIEAVQWIKKLKPDIIFLDIQMPGLNGFEVLTQLDEIPEVIFSTAYDQYAIKAFEVHAIDYLLKPYGRSRFENTMTRILKNQDKLIPLTESLLKSEVNFPQKIILQKGTKKIMINVGDIIYAEAFGDYTKIYSPKGDFLSMKGIGQLMESLDPKIFMRLHRSHFVNKEHITEIKKGGRYHYAYLLGGVKIKISESYLPGIKKISY